MFVNWHQDSILKATGVINVRYQPWGSGAFGQQLRERWGSWVDHLLETGALMEFIACIAFDKGVDIDSIVDPETWLREAIADYLSTLPNYARTLDRLRKRKFINLHI